MQTSELTFRSSRVLVRRVYGDLSAALHRNDLIKIFTAIVSEGMLSISNFVIGILMLKYATKSEYGMYVLLFSFIGILSAYQNAIINAPLVVLINTKYENERRTYVSSLAVGKNYLFVPPLLLLIITGSLYCAINSTPGIYIIELFVLSAVALIYVSKEFIRVLYFVKLDTNAIFKMDLFNLTTVLMGMLLLVYVDRVSSLSAIIVLGCGYFASYIFGKRKDLHYSPTNNKSIRGALIENWFYGKWASIGATSGLLQERGYIYIVSGLLGLSNVADIAAARLFLMPISLLNVGSSKIAVAKGSKMLSLNMNNKFREFVLTFICILLIISLFYFLLIILTSNLIIGFLGRKYINAKGLILLWGVFFLISTIRTQLGTALIAYKQFKKVAKSDIWGSTLAITSCFLLVFTIGRSGAIISLMLGEFVTLILYLKLYLRLK